MLPPNRSLRPLVVASLAGASLLLAAARAASSPFLPPQSSGAAPTQGAPLEYGGYLTTPDGKLYRIRDPQKKTGVFLKLNERDTTLDVIVKQHDATSNTVTIEHQGRTMTLEERVAKIVSSGNAAAMTMPAPPPPAVPNVAPAVTQSVVVNPTPADEQKRLEAVAAEVQRRRALREQAQQQMGPGTTPQPMPQPPAMQPQQMQPQVRNFPAPAQPRGGTDRPQPR